MPTKQRPLILVGIALRLHYELERNVIAKWLYCHDLQFTHRELPTDDRFVQIRGFPCRECEVISSARILKRKGPHLCIELNLVSIVQPFGILITLRVRWEYELTRRRHKNTKKMWKFLKQTRKIQVGYFKRRFLSWKWNLEFF